MRPLALVVALALSACATVCARPPTRDPSRRRVVTVGLQPGWPSSHADQIRAALAGRWLPGVLVRVVGPGQPADVELRHAEFAGCGVAGLHHRDTHVIEWDPVCTPGTDVAAHVLRHEVMHHLNCRHLCRYAGEPGCVGPPVGIAIMNPRFDLPDARVEHGKACCAPPGIAVDPTPADVAELRRALEGY